MVNSHQGAVNGGQSTVGGHWWAVIIEWSAVASGMWVAITGGRWQQQWAIADGRLQAGGCSSRRWVINGCRWAVDDQSPVGCGQRLSVGSWQSPVDGRRLLVGSGRWVASGQWVAVNGRTVVVSRQSVDNGRLVEGNNGWKRDEVVEFFLERWKLKSPLLKFKKYLLKILRILKFFHIII